MPVDIDPIPLISIIVLDVGHFPFPNSVPIGNPNQQPRSRAPGYERILLE
jgi:hypothetical protein